MGVVVKRYIYRERFPHITYPYSSCICSFLQQHPYFLFFLKMFFVLVALETAKSKATSSILDILCMQFSLQYRHTDHALKLLQPRLLSKRKELRKLLMCPSFFLYLLSDEIIIWTQERHFTMRTQSFKKSVTVVLQFLRVRLPHRPQCIIIRTSTQKFKVYSLPSSRLHDKKKEIHNEYFKYI